MYSVLLARSLCTFAVAATQTHSGHVLLSGTTLLDQTDGRHGEAQQSTGSRSTAMGASSLPGEMISRRWSVG